MKKQKKTLRELSTELQICGNCNFCEKNDGKPYCYLKDLYTTVELNHKCDERDSRGRLMFRESSEGRNETGN